MMLFTTINARIASALTGVALAAAVAAPTALAQELVGSPDALDANNRYHPQLGETAQGFGSPDARDANAGYDPPVPVAQPVAVDASAPAPAPAPGGFDWASAAIGAAAGTGLLIVLFASARPVAAASRRIRVAR